MPSLEHNNKVTGESLDLIKYIDSHFEGPALYPDVRQNFCNPDGDPTFLIYIYIYIYILIGTFLRLKYEFYNTLIILQDPNKRQFAEELLSYTYTFNRAVIFSLKGDSENEISKIRNLEIISKIIIKILTRFIDSCQVLLLIT